MNAKERWDQLVNRGEFGPHPLTQDPWRSFYNGWLEGRSDMLEQQARAMKVRSDVKLGMFILGLLAGVCLTFLSTTAIAQDVPAYQGFGHTMPPPMNMVGAGFNLEHAAKSRKAATYAFIGGGALTGILATANGTKGTAAPWITGTLTMGLSLSLNLHGLRWEDRAADLWQCGYSPDQLWETIPDSLGQGELRKVSIPKMIDGTKIHVPARFK